MSFIDDMKIGKKLIGGFLIVLLLLAIVAVVGYTSISTMNTRSASMYDDRTVPIGQLGQAESSFYQARGDIYKSILIPAEKDSSLTAIDADIANIDKQIAAYSSSYMAADEKAAYAQFQTDYTAWKAEVATIKDVINKGDTKQAIVLLAKGGKLSNLRQAVSDDLDKLSAINIDAAKVLDQENNDTGASSTMTMIIATIVAIIAGLGIALYLSRSITGPVDQVKTILKEIQLGHLGNRLNLNRKDEIGEMAETLDKFADELQKYVIGTLKMISEGDLSRTLKPRDDKDEIVPAVNTINTTLKALVEEANMLSKAAVEGKLATRGNADKFKGGYWEIVAGVNKTLDSVVGPVNEAMRVSGEYAQGNFTARVDEKLNVQGDFVRFKQALNNIGIEVSKSMTVVNQQVGDLAASAEEANASVEEVSAGSAQVAKNASGVSVNAEKATQGVEQVQKAMEDLSRTIQDVATKSEAVAKIVQDTTNFSKEGMELAQKTEQGMQGITKSSNEVNTIILEIKSQMDKISEIVSLITDLANQTNLLALNAAIEAARAGDAGRGFAVVATEVKSLAVESRASAERISEMIDNLQKQTLSAVDAVSAANSGVKEGSEALHETLNSFNKIVTAIDKISQNVSEVAAAAEEQAASVEEVTASVNEVGGLMQNTTSEATDAAAASEESSAAIDQITKVVANVNTIVDKVTKEVSRFKC
jgi:methyl-accepting chemotaxis protein